MEQTENLNIDNTVRRFKWLRCLMCGSAAARFLGLLVQISPGEWMSLSWECCVLSGRGLCVRLITCTEESYPVWCVWVWQWSLDTDEVLAHWGQLRLGKNKIPLNFEISHHLTSLATVNSFPPTHIYLAKKVIYFFWRYERAMASSFMRFLDHTQRRTIVGRTPLDEWSARRRDLYLTTHNTHNRRTSMPRLDSNPQSL